MVNTWLLKRLYPSSFVWDVPTKERELYLTFDDGPHETATPFVLDQLKQFNAKATFFCIGKNVVEQPEIYRRILDEGHRVGNHTHNHLNGWKTENKTYLSNIFEASRHIDSNLFRPPYGRIKKFQAKLLQAPGNASANAHLYKIIMWSVLSADFDMALTPQKCLDNVVLNAKPGSIILFHDSTKAWDRMSFALPKVLAYFSREGYSFKSLPG
ncbi:polysaccharide deacetylase family protein [Danxiaibacter flavus]|uniref:Polysaccharide deacetylase family protein n=1 Tax=Danxiaibacter flavus TaxID=3049108 RepID=A0ABV3ZGE7_9BACT|nr:polysaccharide deacetylase family protein [Chitinophagaceae bacterium DXS]